jgi:hypothetical protein
LDAFLDRKAKSDELSLLFRNFGSWKYEFELMLRVFIRSSFEKSGAGKVVRVDLGTL